MTEGKIPNLGERRVVDDRWRFINDIQDWFEKKDRFWLVISVLTFSSVLILEVMLNFALYDNPSVKQEIGFLLITILVVFVFSIFWRNLFQTLLSLAGALATYGGIFFFYTLNGPSQLVSTHVADRLGYGIKNISIITITPSSVADPYFIIGMIALVFCLGISIKPIFSKPRDRDNL